MLNIESSREIYQKEKEKINKTRPWGGLNQTHGKKERKQTIKLVHKGHMKEKWTRVRETNKSVKCSIIKKINKTKTKMYKSLHHFFLCSVHYNRFCSNLGSTFPRSPRFLRSLNTLFQLIWITRDSFLHPISPILRNQFTIFLKLGRKSLSNLHSCRI